MLYKQTQHRSKRGCWLVKFSQVSEGKCLSDRRWFTATFIKLLASAFILLSHGAPLSVSSDSDISPLFHDLTLPHLLKQTWKSRVVALKKNYLCLLFYFPTMCLLTMGFLLHSTFPFTFFVFKVFIHFDFILHSFLFLIFLPLPLFPRLQHPAMLTQPVLRGSELLKPLLPFPLCTSGPQRKEQGKGGKEEEKSKREMERMDL